MFGVLDVRLGEKVAALAQPRSPLDLDDLEEFCRQQLADYKVPESWGLLDELAVNAMGEIIRSGLPGLLDQTRQA